MAGAPSALGVPLHADILLVARRGGVTQTKQPPAIPARFIASEAGSVAEAARTSYRYWVRANDRALRIGDSLGPERFRLLRVEEIYAAPEAAVETIARFIGAQPDPALRADIAALPQMPRSVGRYREEDLSVFSEKNFRALARFGYSADDGPTRSGGTLSGT